MPTVNELFSDTVDKTLVIDSDLRTIKIPSSITNIGVESDDDVTRLYFRMPRYYNDVDLSKFVIRINYLNANKDPDAYTATDATVEGDYICFSWLVGRFAVMYKGTVKFIVCLKKFHSDGTVDKEFNTTTAFLPVLEGLETEEAVVEAYPDAIAAAAYEAILLGLDNGLKGDPGYTPVKGIDYYTPAERDEFAEEVVNSAKGVYANAYKQTVKGEIIRVDDISPLEHTVGVKVRGKNLIPYPYSDVDITRDGITFASQPDGGIKITGTASANTSFNLVMQYRKALLIEKSRTYTVTVESNLTAETGYVYVQYWNDGVSRYSESLRKGSLTFTANSDGSMQIGLVVLQGQTYDETVYIQMEENSISTEYEPYIDPSTIALVRHGKNMFPVTVDKTYNGVTLTKRDNYYVLNGTATGSGLFITPIGYIPPGIYTLSANNPKHNNLGDKFVPIVQVYSPSTLESIAVIDSSTYGVTTATLKGGVNYESRIRYQEGITYDNFIVKPQLEVGSKATGYEEYTAETYTPATDGTVENVYSVSPTMTLYTDTPGVTIEAEYSRDTNALIGDISSALDILIDMQEASIAKLDNIVGGVS